VSPKECSLAFEDTVKEFEDFHENEIIEPELTVIVNARYLKSSSHMTSDDVIQVQGRMTVSF
jgi:hypothetical protein